MSFQLSNVRRWLVATTLLVVVVVTAAYFHARHRLQSVIQHVPEKMGIEFKQTANGFSISKSEFGRSIFRMEANKAVQYKEGGRAELHDVHITLYGRDSSRFDQIFGKDFIYDQQTGDVVSQGEVDMDLQSNPSGVNDPDQTSPTELKNPVHLVTHGLIFNQKTGDAYTKERVDFSIPEASGSSIGLSYVAKTSLLTLASQVRVVFKGETPTIVTGQHGIISKDPHVVVLSAAHLDANGEHGQADEATLFLRPDNSVERLLARGNVLLQSSGPQSARVNSDQLEAFMTSENQGQPADGGQTQQVSVKNAILSGNVRFETLGGQPMQGSAGRALLSFGSNNSLKQIHAMDNVRLFQHQQATKTATNTQDFELTAPVVDFFLVDGKRIERAETSGPPQIVLLPTQQGSSSAPAGQKTVITASKFEAKFDDLGQLSTVHGQPETRVVNMAPGQPDRVSTGHTLDASFVPGTGIQTMVQQGDFTYLDGERKAWADRARYTPGDQILVLTGSPRIVDKGMTTTAHTVRMNRATGDGFAEGNVKSTYTELKPDPNGGFLSSSSPIHVTARSMTAHRSPAVALYTGDARLWQDDNLVQAPSIEFDRDHRTMDARNSSKEQVSTVLVQSGKDGKVTPVRITSDHLTYADAERKAHFEGNVVSRGEDLTITSAQMNVFLQPRDQTAGNQSLTSAGKIERVVAWDHVVLVQPGRRGTGEQLVYTAADDKFVLTGGPPSIFDAEHGKVTGDSLTLFRTDDRVVVDGSDKSLAVTQTRVAR